jgi:uncharacterized repeat protein (TIGR01451 family)
MAFREWFSARAQRGAQRIGRQTLVFQIVALAAIVALCGTTPLLAQSPGFTNFSSAANLTLNGNAAAPFFNGSVNVLRLNPALIGQDGSAWFNVKQPLTAGFTSVFKFQITNSNEPPAPFPADGLAFVIQNAPPNEVAPFGGTAALGGAGGGIGYDTIPNSLAVEFDTFQNPGPGPNNDPDGNHVGVQSCGTGPNSADHHATYNDGTISCNLGLVSPETNLSDGQVHTVTISYLPSTCIECSPRLFVNLDGTELFPDGIAVDLSSRLSLDHGTAWVGFTGATGALIENNDIVSWNFSPTTITQPAPAGVFTTFNFGSYLYKVRPNQNIDALTVTEVPTDPASFNAGPSFPGAKCIVYDNTGGKCIEFHAACSSPSNNACSNVSYDVVTSYDVPAGPPITNPGFLKATNQDCNSSAIFDLNIITQFLQTRSDPTTKGTSKPSFSCFVAVQNVTYQPADLDILNLAARKVKPNTNLTYVSVVANFGPSGAQGVAITHQIPAGTSFVSSALCSFTNGCSNTYCTNDALKASCTVGNLGKFGLEFMLMTVKVNAPPGSILSDTATVTGFNPDPRPPDNSSTAVTYVVNADQ